MNHRTNGNRAGSSLMEMLAVINLLAVFVVLAIPMFSRLVLATSGVRDLDNQCTQTVSIMRQLRNDLRSAESLSILNGSGLTIRMFDASTIEYAADDGQLTRIEYDIARTVHRRSAWRIGKMLIRFDEMQWRQADAAIRINFTTVVGLGHGQSKQRNMIYELFAGAVR